VPWPVPLKLPGALPFAPAQQSSLPCRAVPCFNLQVAMLFPEEDLQQLQYQPLINDAASQAYWWKKYSK